MRVKHETYLILLYILFHDFYLNFFYARENVIHLIFLLNNENMRYIEG